LSLNQVFDRPQNGRLFFEQIIRDNLAMGRAENIPLIFGRKVMKTTPSKFCTRIVTKDVIGQLKIVKRNSLITDNDQMRFGTESYKPPEGPTRFYRTLSITHFGSLMETPCKGFPVINAIRCYYVTHIFNVIA
jgi:hypothetical protein